METDKPAPCAVGDFHHWVLLIAGGRWCFRCRLCRIEIKTHKFTEGRNKNE